MIDIATLKHQVDFAALVQETHDIARSGKVCCPFHDDQHPSCHIYQGGFKCFACGAYGDAIDWLEQVQQLDTAHAIRALAERAGQPSYRPKRPRKRRQASTASFKTISRAQWQLHQARLKRLTRLPKALEGRGFTLKDAQRLCIAEVGGDALFPIIGPEGEVFAIKRRAAVGPQRYTYLTSGHGNPAWCSANLGACDVLLVMEGELNAMVSHLALEEAGFSMGLMGTAGSSGSLHLEALRGRVVAVYADDDPAGQHAAVRWAAQARRAKAARVQRLTPFEHDACDMAGRYGRTYLAARLVEALGLATAEPSAQPGQASQGGAIVNALPF